MLLVFFRPKDLSESVSTHECGRNIDGAQDASTHLVAKEVESCIDVFSFLGVCFVVGNAYYALAIHMQVGRACLCDAHIM